MKYMVMECHTGYAVLLDEEGRFWKAADLHYEVGQTVENPLLMKQPQPSGRRRITRLVSSTVAAAAACLFLIFGFSYYQNYLRIYSSIYLSINPEVQMDLNRYGNVVRLTGTNEDGAKLLEGYSGRGKDKLTVADELIDRAIEMGFLSEGGQVSFFIDSPEDALFQEYGTELRAEINEHLDGRITITIEIVNYQDTPETESSTSESSVSETAAPQSAAPSGGDTDYVPADDTEDDYGDTDYGPENDGVTDDSPSAPTASPAAPSVSAPAASDAESTPPDHTDGDTDYEPENAAAPVPDDDAAGDGDSDDDGDDADDDDDNDGDDDNDDDDNDDDDNDDD